MRMISGNLKTKHDEHCGTTFSDSFSFETKVPFKDCGTQKSAFGTYTNLVFLKDSATPLITIRDKLIQVICRIFDGGDIQVTYQLEIQGNRSTL